MNLKKLTYLLIPPALAVLLLLGWGLFSGIAKAAESAPASLVRTELVPRQVEGPDGINAPDACTPDTPNMVSYWPLDDGDSATTFEDVVGTNDGSCTGMGCPASTTGIVATAFDFTGGNYRIDVPDDPSLSWENGDSLSFEMWVNTDQDCTGNKVFLGKHGSPGDSSWWVGCGTGGFAKYQLEDSNAVRLILTGTVPITDTAWHHVVAIRDAATDINSIYVDATLDVTGTIDYTGVFTNTNNLNMGYFSGGYFYDGTLDEVAIYKKALTPAEIQAHYNGGSGTSYCEANETPVVTNPGEQTDDEGDAISLQIVATDPNAGDKLTYTATELPTGLSIDPDSGLISGTIDFGAATGSPYTTMVTATDLSLATDSATFTWNVNPAANTPPDVDNPGDQSNDEGDPVSLQIVATDPEMDALVYSADSLPTGLDIDENTGLISGTIAMGASSGSPYTVMVTATDPGSLSDTETFTWTVAPVVEPPDEWLIYLPIVIRND